MERGFRLTLRVALVLVILAGAGLVIYAVTGDGAGGRAGAGAASPTREEPSAPPSPPAGAPGEAPEGTAPAPTRAASGTSSEHTTELEGFNSVFRDSEKDRDEAIVTGERAVLREDLYDVVMPVVTVFMWDENKDEGLEVELGKVRVRAERAELDRERGLVRLFGGVTAVGEDYGIRTESVLYEVRQRRLTSEDPVRMQRDRTDKEGNRQPAMVVSGRGLSVDLTVRRVAVLRDVEALLQDVSGDFLAAELEELAEDEGSNEVRITCSGPMAYEHLQRKVSFAEEVRVVSGDKELTCDQLDVLLGETKEKDRLEVSDIVATGNVRMAYADQVGRGERLEWHNVTQTGVLSGEPASLETPQFEMGGAELNFYRMNDRFHANGPGALRWRGPKQQSPTVPAAAGEEAWGLGPLQMSGDEPVDVAWDSSMTYQVADHVATFEGNVRVRQQTSSLTCGQLVLSLEPDSAHLRKIEAGGGVTIHDEPGEQSRDVTCDRLIWDAPARTVELIASEGKTVSVTTGPHAIVSRHVMLDNARRALICPTAGRLTVRPGGEHPSGEAADDLPVEVTWEESMRFDQEPEPVARFSGNCVARRGDHKMKGQRLRADFDEQMALTRVVVTEDAVVDVLAPANEQPPQPGAGSRASAEGAPLPLPGMAPGGGERWRLGAPELVISVAERRVSVPGAGSLTVLRGDSPAGTITWEGAASLGLAESLATFTSGVAADVSGALLKSNELRLHFDEERNLRHIWAEGSVYFAPPQEGAWEMQSDSAEAVFAGGNQLRQVIARQNVKVRDERRRLQCRLLQLFLEPAEGQQEPELQRAVAQDDVHLSYEDEERLEAGGDRLEWDRTTDTYVLTGEPDAYMRSGQLVFRNETILLDRTTGRLILPRGEARPARTTVPAGVQ